MAIIGSGGRLQGSVQVLRNLNRAIEAIEGDLSEGVRLGLLRIKRAAVKLAPIEYGKLRESAFIDTKKSKLKITGRVGFKSPYAVFVHEAPMKLLGKKRPSGKGNYWDIKGERKFLEKAYIREAEAVLETIRRRARR